MNKYNNEKYSHKIPDMDAEDKIWEYALSFKGYEWVKDKYKNKELENLLIDEHKKILDAESPNWREGFDDISPIFLISLIGGKNQEDCSIEELRAVLFFEQRGNRYHNDYPDDSLKYAKDIIKCIKEKQSNDK